MNAFIMTRTALSFLLFTAACTGTIGGDDPPTEQVTNTVTVTVRDGYMPIGDIQVIFQNGDDSVVAEARTGADGRATAEMPAGGNVTVIRTYPAPLDPELPKRPDDVFTIVGVRGGDLLDVTGEMDLARGTPNAINVKVPNLAQGTVKIMTPCGGGEGTGPTIPITVMGCPTEVPFYVMDGTGQSFLVRHQVSENVDLSFGAFTDRLGTSLSATNVPADITAINAELRIQADAYEIASSGTKRVDQTAQTATMPDIVGVDGVLVASYQRATGGTQLVVKREPYALGPTIVDGGVTRIPYTSKVTYAPTGVSWSEDTMGTTGTVDFVLATLNVTRPDPIGGPNDVEFVRTIVAPHGVPNLRTPQLPIALYNPIADDTIAGSLALVSVTGGYDGVRNKVFAYPSITDIAPMNGIATISYTGAPPR